MRALECAASEAASGDVERVYHRRWWNIHDIVTSGSWLEILVA